MKNKQLSSPNTTSKKKNSVHKHKFLANKCKAVFKFPQKCTRFLWKPIRIPGQFQTCRLFFSFPHVFFFMSRILRMLHFKVLHAPCTPRWAGQWPRCCLRGHRQRALAPAAPTTQHCYSTLLSSKTQQREQLYKISTFFSLFFFLLSHLSA